MDIVVFNMFEPEIQKVVNGETVGTIVTKKN